MDITNTVTISIDEYFELRQKAQMNEYLLREFGTIDSRLNQLEQKWFDINDHIRELERRVK